MTQYTIALELTPVDDFDGEPYDVVDQLGLILQDSKYRVVTEMHGGEYIALVQDDG